MIELIRKRWIAGQPGNLKSAMRTSILMLIFTLALLGAGCTNTIHDKTRALLPPGSVAQLELRLDEARRAEVLAVQAASKLRDRLATGLDGNEIAIDVDRVEAAAFEFERRLASARDAAARCNDRARFTGELQRLERRSQELAAYVQSLRRAGPAAAAGRLDTFLRGAK